MHQKHVFLSINVETKFRTERWFLKHYLYLFQIFLCQYHQNWHFGHRACKTLNCLGHMHLTNFQHQSVHLNTGMMHTVSAHAHLCQEYDLIVRFAIIAHVLCIASGLLKPMFWVNLIRKAWLRKLFACTTTKWHWQPALLRYFKVAWCWVILERVFVLDFGACNGSYRRYMLTLWRKSDSRDSSELGCLTANVLGTKWQTDSLHFGAVITISKRLTRRQAFDTRLHVKRFVYASQEFRFRVLPIPRQIFRAWDQFEDL